MPLIFAPGGGQTPAPNTIETNVTGWAHCGDARCPGYGQKPAEGIRTIVEHTIGSRGGDGIFVNIVENTNEYLRFSDSADIACPDCGKDREISLQERPVYPVITGFPQLGLLQTPQFDPSVRNTKADEDAALAQAEQNKRMVELEATVARLTAALED